jgi:hypothetical protein
MSPEEAVEYALQQATTPQEEEEEEQSSPTVLPRRPQRPGGRGPEAGG